MGGVIFRIAENRRHLTWKNASVFLHATQAKRVNGTRQMTKRHRGVEEGRPLLGRHSPHPEAFHSRSVTKKKPHATLTPPVAIPDHVTHIQHCQQTHVSGRRAPGLSPPPPCRRVSLTSSMVSSSTFTRRIGYTLGRMRLLNPHAPTCRIDHTAETPRHADSPRPKALQLQDFVTPPLPLPCHPCWQCYSCIRWLRRTPRPGRRQSAP